MSHKGVKVCIRTRPTAMWAQDEIMVDEEAKSITVHQRAGEGYVNNKQEDWGFRFDEVMHNASQERVYEELCRAAVRGVVDGINGTIMAYGQTGAGKSYTMIGDTRNFRNRGIAPRAITQLFQEIGARPETAFEVAVSYLEIYNERMFDLLAGESSAAAMAAGGAVGGSRSEMAVVEDPVRGVTVRGLQMEKADNEGSALDKLFQGELARTTAEHELNKRSNRSHCIFTLHIAQRSRLGTRERVRHSKLHIVDLAGSERIKKTMLGGTAGSVHDPELLRRESMNINKSLAYLEQCVVALTARGGKTYVPYRQSKLTAVLKDALGGNCNTLLIACIWGERAHIEETISTLKLAQRMMRVRNKVKANVAVDPEQLVHKYERVIKQLRQELAMHNALADRGDVSYDDYTPEQQESLAGQLRTFVEAEGPEEEEAALPLQSVQQMREILRQVKVLVRTVQQETADNVRTQLAATGGLGRGGSARAGSRGDGGVAGGGGGADEEAAGAVEVVGELDDRHGMAIGLAAPGSRPATGLQAPEAAGGGAGGGPSPRATAGAEPGTRGSGGVSAAAAVQSQQLGGGGGDGGGDGGREAGGGAVPRDRQQAWNLYRAPGQPGHAAAMQLREALQTVKSLRQEAAAIAAEANSHKEEVDAAREDLRVRRGPAAGQGEVDAGGDMIVGEDEYAVMRQEAAARRAYRDARARLEAAKAALREQHAGAAVTRTRLVQAFQTWYANNTGVALSGGVEAVGRAAAQTPGGSAAILGGTADAMLFAPGSSMATLGSPAARSPAVAGFAPARAPSFGGTGTGIQLGGNTRDESGDRLDDAEAFAKLEEQRIAQADPDSVAFFRASKHMDATLQKSPPQARKAFGGTTKRGQF